MTVEEPRPPGVGGGQAKLPGMCRREDRDIKREKTENFWMGDFALREGGREEVVKQEEFPCTGRSLTGRLKGEPWNLRKTGKAET